MSITTRLTIRLGQALIRTKINSIGAVNDFDMQSPASSILLDFKMRFLYLKIRNIKRFGAKCKNKRLGSIS